MSEAIRTAYGAIGLGALVGAAVGSVGKKFIESSRARAELRAALAYDRAVESALNDAESLGKLAKALVSELAAAHAKNFQLENALEQRQAYLERMRSPA